MAKRPKRFNRKTRQDARGNFHDARGRFARRDKTDRIIERTSTKKVKPRKARTRELAPQSLWDEIADMLEPELGERPIGGASEMIHDKWGEVWHRYDFQWSDPYELELFEYVATFPRKVLAPFYHDKTILLLDLVGTPIAKDGRAQPIDRLGWKYPASATENFNATFEQLPSSIETIGGAGWSPNYIADAVMGFSVHCEAPKWFGKKVAEEKGIEYGRAKDRHKPAKNVATKTRSGGGRNKERSNRNASGGRSVSKSKGSKRAGRGKR